MTSAETRVRAPWTDPTLLDAAVDVTCRVRDDSPAEVRGTLALVPHDALADLVMVLAAMVDADAPLDAVRRWSRPGFVGYRERPRLACKRGHPMVGDNLVANGRFGGKQRWRCRTCMTDRSKGQPA